MALELTPSYKQIIKAGNFQSLASVSPWSHYVLDDLIPKSAFVNLQQRLLNGSFDFESVDDHPAKLQLCYMQDLELASFLLGPEMRFLLEGIAGAKLSLNEKLAIQFRQMTSESPAFAPHEDLIEAPSLIALYYIAPNWTPGCGGELILLESEISELSSQKHLAPLENRLVLFKSEKHCWHAVNRVKDWHRLMVLTEWFMRHEV